jgi:TP901 family phage tail tape measure protein
MPREIFKLFGTIAVNGLNGVSGALKSIDSQFQQADKALVKFGRQSVKIGTTMTKNLTVPIVALGAVVTKFGADFEKSMQTSISIMGDVSAETRAQMEKTARSIATSTTVSANDAAKAYYFLSSAGYSAAASIGALPLVAKFAMAGQLGLEQATSLLADAQNSLGLKVDDNVKNTENLVRVTDVLSQANNLANGSVQDFSMALANKGGAAIKMLNKDIEEGVAVLAAYASVGVKGVEAGDKLNIVLRDLQTAAIKQKPAFAKAGIAVYDAAGNMRNMADIIGDLEKRFAGMSDEEKRTELMTLGFQDRSVAATMQLIGMSGAIRDYEVKLRSAAGVTNDVANKQMKNFWDQLTIVKNRLIDVGITLYQTLQPILMNTVIPALENASNKVAGLANWFSSLNEGTKKNIISILAITAAVGPLILILGKSILIVKSLTVAFTLARTAVIGLTVAMATNPFAIAVIGVAALAAGLLGAKKAYDNLIESHKKYTLLTTDQVKIKAYTDSVSSLRQKIVSLGDSLNDESVVNKELGGTVTDLTEQARALGYVVEGNNNKKIESLLVIDEELRGVRTLTGALVKYNAAKKEETKKETGGGGGETLSEKQKKYALEMQQQLEKERDNILGLLDLEEKEALAKEENSEESRLAIKQLYAEKRKKIYQEEADKQQEIIDNMNAQLDESDKIKKEDILKNETYSASWTKTRKDDIKAELQAELDKAREIGTTEQTIFNIKKYYADQEKQLSRDTAASWISDIGNMVGQVVGLFSGMNENESIGIENNYKKRKESIENSVMGEKAKTNALENLDKEFDKKRSAMRRKQAIQEKIDAMFSIGINTAVAVVKALPNLILAGIIGGIGLLQEAIVASRPIPLKEGGMVRGGRGGVTGQIGEGSEDELITPMESGVDIFARKIVDASRRMFGAGSPGLAFAGAADRHQKAIEHHWHIGTLVADDRGLKEMERRLGGFRVSEAQRKGQEA